MPETIGRTRCGNSVCDHSTIGLLPPNPNRSEPPNLRTPASSKLPLSGGKH
ncbi:MAG: hypothetical protein KIY11_08740 [Thermoplasmata archaeon]|nr:hypothetical protein [Candidatus Sysuiplasma acidicola]